MESDRFIYFLGRYVSLILGIVCVISIIVEFWNRIMTNNWDDTQVFFSSVLLIICLAHYKYYSHKFVMIEFGNQKLSIKDNKNLLIVSWLDVESISQSSFSLSGISGIYTLKVKGVDKEFMFGTGSSINLLGQHFDNSELASLINKMKRELRL